MVRVEAGGGLYQFENRVLVGTGPESSLNRRKGRQDGIAALGPGTKGLARDTRRRHEPDRPAGDASPSPMV